jgi:hypothetical protein
MRLASAAPLAAVISILGCDPSVLPLAVPDANSIGRIEGTIANSAGSVSVTDSSRIAEIVELVSRLNDDMRRPFATYPAATHTISFHSHDGSTSLILFLGLDWLGGRDGLTSISASDRTELLESLEIADYYFQVAE